MKHTLRFLSLLMAMLCSLSLAACTGNETKNPSDETDPSGTDETYIPYDYELSEYLSLDSYTGITLPNEIEAVSEADIDEYIAELLASYSILVEKDGPIEEGDTATIDFVGTMDGVAFEGGTSSGYALEIGSDSFIDGFEDGLIGASAGDTVVLDLHFPDPYINNLAYSGLAVQFTVTVQKVSERSTPTLTDAYVSETFGIENVEMLRTLVQAQLESEAESALFQEQAEALWTELLLRAEVITFPEREYNDKAELFDSYYSEAAEAESMTVLAYAEEHLGYSETEWYTFRLDQIDSAVKEELVLYYLAQRESVTVTAEEYTEYVELLAGYYGGVSTEMIEMYLGKEQIELQLLFEKLMERLIELNLAA